MNNGNKTVRKIAAFVLDRLRDRFEAMAPIVQLRPYLADWREK